MTLKRFLFILAFTSPLLAIAQPGQPVAQGQDPDREDRVQALRIAFFVEELELTASESARFLPIWNNQQGTLREQGDAMRAIEHELAISTNDAQSKQLLEELKSLRIEGVELRHDAVIELAEIVGYQRAAQIPQIERKFRSNLMKRRMGDRRPGKPAGTNRPGGPPRH